MEWQSAEDEFDVKPFQFEYEFENIKKQNYIEAWKYIQKISNPNLEKEEPFIIIYKSRPIRGIILELWGKNPNYNWEV